MNEKTDPIHYVAIDVSKSTLQVQDDRRAFTLPATIPKVIASSWTT